MNIGRKIKKKLIDVCKTQAWLSEITGIPYDTLNASLNGKRVLKYDELAVILWVLGMSPSDVIEPIPPKAS